MSLVSRHNRKHRRETVMPPTPTATIEPKTALVTGAKDTVSATSTTTAGPTTLTPTPPPSPDPDASQPMTWAKEIVDWMEANFTGKQTITFMKNAINAHFNHPDHKGKDRLHPDRHMTADELIRVLEQGMMDSPNLIADLTIHKARSLRNTGTWVGVKLEGHPADAIKELPKGNAPARKVPELVKTESAEVTGAEIEVIGPRQVKGAVPLTQPEFDPPHRHREG